MRPPRNKRSYVKIFKDPDSATGISAAILIKNVTPKKTMSGYYHIAFTKFLGNFYLNCDGVKIRPKVQAKIWCEIPKRVFAEVRKKKKLERAMNNSPMLT